MHSLEAGIIVSISAFFFFSFLTFTFRREQNISKELIEKAKNEAALYSIENKKFYEPEKIKNILSIVKEMDENYGGNDEANGD